MFAVYWIDSSGSKPTSNCKTFEADEMNAALKFIEELRKQNRTEQKYAFITMTSENSDLVGGLGATTIGDDLKLPDGYDYTWKKRRP